VILVIDNYDSFTYNLVQAIGTLDRGADIRVVRNDAATLNDIAAWNPTHIVLSPGPCTPHETGICKDVVRAFAERTPILGVCLGHQCIAEAFGASVTRAARIMHGKTSSIHHRAAGLYEGLPNPFVATRYHSLCVEHDTLPDGFEITAWTDQDELMGLRHRNLPLEGVQFHPESFLTLQGDRLILNFLRRGSDGESAQWPTRRRSPAIPTS